MPIKTLLVILGTAALIWGAHFVPQLDWLKAPDLETLGRVVGLEPPPKPVEEPKAENRPPVEIIVPPANPPLNLPPPETPEPNAHPTPPNVYVKLPDIERGPPTSIVDTTGQMHFFYEALARTQAKQPGAITRVLHYGDSPVTADSITADARAMLQAQYGDAGHGFVLLAKPWAWYMHRGVDIAASGWIIETASTAPRGAR